MALTTIKTGAIADDAVTADKVANAINTSIATNTAKDLTALSATNLTSGTVPDARFPATLPAASAANLTAVPAANITGTLPAISAANLTNVPAANITGTLPAISGANLTGIASKVVDIKTVRHTTSTSFNTGSTNLASANVFYFPNTSAASLEITYTRTSASNAIILQGHYSINTTSNSHAMYAFVAQDSSIRKNLGIDEHNAKREYLNVAFFCMFTAAELGGSTGSKTYTVCIGSGDNRTHTGVRCPNMASSYSDTSNAAHYSEMTLMEVVAS